MKLKILTQIFVFVLCQLTLVVYADIGAGAEPEESASPSEKSLEAPDEVRKDVPKLNIVWNCGECIKNEKVIPLIEKAYKDEALTRGENVLETDVAEVQIIEFNQRNPGLRAFLGALSGKDRLGLKIDYKGKEYIVRNYSANGWKGINFLCEFIAKETYWKLAGSSD
jgi:hypothetical protein